MAGTVPSNGDKKVIVGPSSGGGPVPSPATTVTDVDASAAVVGVSLNYAREDHRHHAITGVPVQVAADNAEGTSDSLARADHEHASPVIYWPAGVGKTENIVANVTSNPTITASGTGITNLCRYSAAVVGAQGDYSTISGGQDCSAEGQWDTVSGGLGCGSIGPLSPSTYNFCGGGYTSAIVGGYCCAITGGYGNLINNSDDPTDEVRYASITGGNVCQVFRSAGRAGGVLACSYMVGEDSFSSGGYIADIGLFQNSKVVPSNQTPGVAANESVDLKTWVDTVGYDLIFRSNKSFVMHVSIVAVDVATGNSATWIYGIRAKCDGLGVFSISKATVIFSDSDVAAALWNVAFSGSGNAMVITFATGAGVTAQVNVCATVDITTVHNQAII